MSYHSYLEIYNLKKELEVYKRALNMACDDIELEYGGNKEDYYDQYLQDARKKIAREKE